MKLVTETQTERQKVLIIDKHDTPLSTHLKHVLEKYENDVYISPKVTELLNRFSLCIFIDEPLSLIQKLSHHKDIKFVFIVTKPHKQLAQIAQGIQAHNVRIIHVEHPESMMNDDLEKILWFTFSTTHERYLTIMGSRYRVPEPPKPKRKKREVLFKLERSIKPKHVFLTIVGIILIAHVLFIGPLLFATWRFYSSAKLLQVKDLNGSTRQAEIGEALLGASKQLYQLVRPTYLLLSVAPTIDNIYQVDDTTNSVIQKTASLEDESKQFMSLLLEKNKTKAQQDQTSTLRQSIQDDIEDVSQHLSILDQKLPTWGQFKQVHDKINTITSQIDTADKLLTYFDSLFAKDGEKTYLVLFSNNMELRPGGGFIGSFGLLHMKNYSLDDFKIYDVYDADGQLKDHIDPPKPIAAYLHQPHWFLRDSAFSPDFYDNYQQAKIFLQKEMNIAKLDGGILITTNTIQNVLQAVDELYLPDFNEKVNAQNFYIKAQLYAENGFFPGSTQKKRFLSAVADQLLLTVEQNPSPKLLEMVQKSLDEKQMVMYFEDPLVQNTINSFYWSGRTINPQCPNNETNCVNDYFFPYDANLGVNKANFFVKHYTTFRANFDDTGMLHNHITIQIKNDSLNDVFPGGTYKDYFQTTIPLSAQIEKITKDDTLVENYDVKSSIQKTVGFYLEVPPQKFSNIDIYYSLPGAFQNGKGVYQLVLQKQIGSANSDIDFSVSFPSNMYIVSQNFSPLVKNNRILYNTTLTADKIFLIELFKD